MIPVVTPAEMRAIDAAAPEPLDVLIQRAGAAVGRVALRQLGGAYGRRVVVVAGKGNNGADGRVAATWLQRRGVRVRLIEAGEVPPVLPASDLVIDAAYGTGFRGSYDPPDPAGAPVLSVDIPSGLDASAMVASGHAAGAVVADHVVTFAALKPGLLGLEPSQVEVFDIGLDVSSARVHVVEDLDVRSALPARRRDAHKYDAAVLVVAGSPGMTGAAALASTAAMRSGSGYCRLAVPGADLRELPASEVVGVALEAEGWENGALRSVERMSAVAIGPGLGRASSTVRSVRAFVAECPMPLVVDADALFALGDLEAAAGVLRGRRAATVLTPHDGELTRLTGSVPGADRLSVARDTAAATGSTVLLKGPVTVVADPDGDVLVARGGSSRLATAGTGDVLTGVVAAFLAAGLPPRHAAAYAAHVHGAAAQLGWRRGFVAGDLLELVPRWLSR